MSTNGSLRIDSHRPRLRLVLLTAASAAVVLAAFALMRDGDTPTRVASTPSAPASPQPSARGDAPFPELDLQLRDVTPQGAVIALASRPATYALGQEVFPGVVVRHIDRDTVTLRFGSQERTLWRASPGTSASTAAATGPAPDAAGTAAPDRQRIDTALLTSARPQAATAFLNEVQVHPDPRGGFVVDHVLPDSRYDRMGLKPGDVVYTLDTPAMRAVDESSMIALMQQTEIELDVYRNGTPMRLRVALNEDAPEAAPR